MSNSNNVFDPETVSIILKWAVTILVAGFIAQFGKKFANFLMDKIGTRREDKGGADDGQEGPAAPQPIDDYALERARLKQEKKKAKSEAKKEKKLR